MPHNHLPLRLKFLNLKKQKTMKKVFALLAITSVMVACNSSSEGTETTTDTTAVTVPVETPAMDTTTAAPAKDTTAVATPQ